MINWLSSLRLDAVDVKAKLLEQLLKNVAGDATRIVQLARGARQVINQAIADKTYGSARVLAEAIRAATERPECRQLHRENTRPAPAIAVA